MVKAQKRLFYVFLFLSACGLVAAFFFQPLAQRMANKYVTNELQARLNAEIKFDYVETHFFPPRLLVGGLQMRPRQGPLKFVRINELRVTPGLGPIFLGRVIIKHIEVNDPVFQVDLSQASPKAKKKKKKFSFDDLSLQKWVKVIINGIDIKGARLTLKLPGEKVFFRIDSGKASFRSGGKKESWKWQGGAILSRGDKEMKVEDVTLAGTREENRFLIKKFSAVGLGAGLSLRGEVFPKAKLSYTFKAELNQVIDSAASLGVLNSEKDIQGQVVSDGRIEGNWESLSIRSKIRSDKLRIYGRNIDALDALVQADQDHIKSLSASFRLNKIPGRLTVRNLGEFRKADFDLELKQAPFEQIEKLIDPSSLSSSLKSIVTAKASGTFQPSKGHIEGNYKISADTFDIKFEPRVERFIPLEFKDLRVEGSFLKQKNKPLAFEDGDLRAQGVDGKVSLSFYGGGKTKGTWLGEISDVSKIFSDAYPLTGSGRFSGGLNVEDSKVNARIDLELPQIRYEETPPSSLKGEVVFKKGEVSLKRVMFRSQGGQARVETLFSSKDPQTSFVKASYNRFPLAWISNIAARAYPVVDNVTGVGSGQVILQDLSEDLRGKISLSSEALSFRDTSFSKVDLGLSIEDESFVISKGEIKGQALMASLKGGFTATEYKDLEFSFKEMPTGLLNIPEWAQKYVETLNGRFVISGSQENPMLLSELELHPPKQGQNTRPVFDKSGRVLLKGLSNDLSWKLAFGSGHLVAKGNLNLMESSFRSEGEFRDFSLTPLIAIVPVVSSGKWSLVGKLGSSRVLNGQVELTKLNFERGNEKMRLTEPAEIKFRNDRVDLKKALFTGNHSSNVAVELGLVENRVQGLIEGNLDLRNILLMDIGIERSEGNAELDIKIGGPTDDLRFAGGIHLSNGLLKLAAFPHPFEDLELRSSLEQSVLYIDQLEAQIGGGLLSAEGDVRIGSTIEQTFVNLSGQLDNSSIRYPEWLPTTLSGPIFLRGPFTGPTLGGNFEIHSARYQDRWDWQSRVLTFGAGVEGAVIPSPDDRRINFDMQFTSNNREFRLRNNIAEGELMGELRLVGSSLNPGLIGRVDIVEGEVEFLDNLFELKSGVVLFEKPDAISPVFDLNASTTVGQTDILLDIRTEGEDILAFLSSQPPTDETNIVSLLTIGVQADELATNNSGGNQEFSSTLLPSVLSSPIQSKLEQDLREIKLIDTLQFVPYFSEEDQNTGLRMIVGKEITRKFKILYSTDLFEVGAENNLRLQQDFSRRVSIQGNIRDNSNNNDENNQEIDVGLDFEFRFDF